MELKEFKGPGSSQRGTEVYSWSSINEQFINATPLALMLLFPLMLLWLWLHRGPQAPGFGSLSCTLKGKIDASLPASTKNKWLCLLWWCLSALQYSGKWGDQLTALTFIADLNGITE